MVACRLVLQLVSQWVDVESVKMLMTIFCLNCITDSRGGIWLITNTTFDDLLPLLYPIP